MFEKQGDENTKVRGNMDEDDENLPLEYASLKKFYFLAVFSIAGWCIGISRWWYFGVSIKEMHLEIRPREIGLVAFVRSIVLALVGVLTTWEEPTASNLGVNMAFPIVLVCALFTAEKNFIVTCMIILLSFCLPLVFGVRKYLSWRERKYLSSERRRHERLKIYISVRKQVLFLLAVGIVPLCDRYRHFSNRAHGHKCVCQRRDPDSSAFCAF